ncbi:MAG: hypothetical protein A2499_14200 [Stygiobacter sp. RIFOXYC12_FULL_38_8]|nr:MAG: hypothetical protein A2X62_01705 [Stygiobacter sp. GWC2_38_9]OGU84419.1 MAG: hypothetical protein A2279_06460 [Stygiobacter sp. RIFOXYA12_FULL_38_9]OGV07731.1 MAG: hypothetical protein A2299_06120 [Stygiobacter sp. RIFOXYB2_FULL_37_11]OGV12734.1 MAG: hypothetical protein A2440_15955 [Stygiobacter sp. RIFOXYC2_FULL_38_25]OGV17614.1 MAG: hypothetical protein A2237_17345 [Stygiobacter sp. RIFOXYA2_FULL_38_8]OGV26992.1 MAG: hypothetical protein A2499_14200 [Stygiobacter sp. RIFOXYC12_FULL_
MKSIKMIFVLLFAITLTTFAQQKEEYSTDPGYFDYSEFAQFKNVEPVTAIHLEGPLLKAISKMGKSKNEKVSEMIAALKFIKVNQFPVATADLDKTENTISLMDKKLQSQKWDRIIKTKEKGKFASVYVKMGEGDNYAGLFVIARDKEDNLTLVNIVGKIDLETIGSLSEQMHLPGLGKPKVEKSEKE